MKLSKLALIMSAGFVLGGGAFAGAGCSSSSSGNSGAGSGSGSGGASDSGADTSTSADTGTESDTGSAGDTGTTSGDAGCKNVELHPNAAGDVYCGYAADGGDLDCLTGTQCCLGGSIGGGMYAPQECATWNAAGTGCTNPADGGALGVACNQVSDCTANGAVGAVACCLQGGASLEAVTGCTYQHAKEGTGIACESTGTGDGGTGACAAGELQVCSANVDCPSGMNCTAVTWKLFDIGVCQ
jgi:hypothetical protein